VTSSVLISGTLTLDTIERGEVMHRDVPGGSALYAAAAARLWMPVQVTGTVGTDFPLDVLDLPQVNHDAVEVLSGPTFRWHARYTDDGAQRARYCWGARIRTYNGTCCGSGPMSVWWHSTVCRTGGPTKA
jgi:sugar/nucleoside kinase (ribokinase family)